MIKLSIIGNLGADAEVKNQDGRSYVSFRVAHSERRQKADGTTKETTHWVSCTINGDGGLLVSYLKKGTKVFVSGDADVRLYNSSKDHCLKAGLNCFVRDIELISTNVDAVPRELYDSNGVAYPVTKAYSVTCFADGTLYDRNSQAYQVTKGWVVPQVAPQPLQVLEIF